MSKRLVPAWFGQSVRQWVEAQEWKVAWAERLIEHLWPTVAEQFATHERSIRDALADSMDASAYRAQEALKAFAKDRDDTAVYYLTTRAAILREFAGELRD